MRSHLHRTPSVRLRRAIRQVHRWLGLLILLQLLFWVSGGVVMSVLPLHAVHGDPFRASREPLALPAGLEHQPLAEVLATQEAGTLRSVTLMRFLDRPVYRLETSQGTRLLDAASGTSLSPLPAELAREAAIADYAGPGQLAALEWIDTPGLEYRGQPLPLWRARFDDARDTTLYIAPDSGRVVARRNDLWRVFDFFWMLHIMDYEEREDFNHPLLTFFAGTALLFLFTGAAMLSYSFRSTRRRPAAS